MAVYKFAPTIDTAAYATGDVIGGKQTLVGAANRAGWIFSIMVFDDDSESDQIDFFFFRDSLTGTYADNGAFTLHADDKANLIGVYSVLATDYIAAGSDATIASVQTKVIPFNATQDNLFVVPVIRANTTFTAATDLRYEIGIAWEG